MRVDDIPLDKAELMAVVLEAFLYGFSLFMFGGTIWILAFHPSTLRVKSRMLAASCLLLLFSTAHLVIDVIRVMEGFIFLQDANPEARISFFANVSHWTFVSKNYVYAAQTLIGDSVVLYRCYAVWQSKLVMIPPVLLWCAVAVTGFSCPFVESQITQGGDRGVFQKTLSRWIISFWTSTLVTNVVTTLLLAYRIWTVDRTATRLSDHRKSELRPILHIIIDAGLIYSFTLFAALICYANGSNAQYIVVDMITPIISITFYMVIIRVGLANRANQTANMHSYGPTTSGHSLAGDRRSRAQIDTTTLRESKINNEHSRSLSPTTPTSPDNHHYRRSEIKFEDIKEEV